jgi:hypothetical protein
MTARPKACRRFVQVITDRIQVQPPDTTHITRTKAHSRTATAGASGRMRNRPTRILSQLGPASAAAAPARHTVPTHPAQCAYKTGRGVLSKSHISPGNLTRRLRIEVTYSL